MAQATLLATLLNPLQAETIFGGDQTTDVNNWTSGHLFMYNESVDLATLANGIERFHWIADFESSAFTNWSPVISVTDGGGTRYYRWNHSGNDWSGNGPLNFSAPFDGDDPYRFDLSQLGNGTIAAPGSDLGGFAIFLDPAGQRALRLNINEAGFSTGDEGGMSTVTGSNTDSFHLFRVAYVAADQRFSVWRDGLAVFAGETALAATNDSVFGAGGISPGDYAFDISGDWELDYIGLHNEAVAPSGVIGNLAVTGSGFVCSNTFFIDFKGRPNTSHKVMSSTNLNDFETMESLFNGANGTTDENGIGRAAFDVAGRVPGKVFFRLEEAE